MTLPGYPRIAIDPAICGGRPTVMGTRVRVIDILEMLAGGASMAEIVEDFPYLAEADVLAALAYAAAKLDDNGERLRRDRQVIRTEGLDDATLEAIRKVPPGKRSRAAGRRLVNPVAV